jgi:hypothetical protein
MYLFDTNHGYKLSKKTTSKSRRGKSLASLQEARAAAKAKKIQQDNLEALQITFYEIESWIEKTSPVLSRMTKELDKASHQFNKSSKKPRYQSPPPSQTHISNDNDPLTIFEQAPTTLKLGMPPKLSLLDTEKLSSMQWSLTFEPGNSMRLETNIKSVEQLIDAVQKIRLLTENGNNGQSDAINNATAAAIIATSDQDYFEELEVSSSCSDGSSDDSLVEIDPSTEYWRTALLKRPKACLENYKHCDMNLSRLTEDVSPNVLSYICQSYWDCLHPKFSGDWASFWDRSGDPKRNQVCIDSGLAMVFLHIVRHNKNACANARSIAYYYYDRARDAMMDYFDSPDCTTIETLLNLCMLCVLCKRDSQSRIYLGLANRMVHQLGIHQRDKLPKDRLNRKKFLKLYMVLYYNDIASSVYAGEPPLIDDAVSNIDFYEIITLNKELVSYEEANYDEKTIAKETFFVHLLELAKIGKRVQKLAKEYQDQNQRHHHSGTLPLRWAKRVQGLEIALATWFERLPIMYRVDPKPTRVFPILSSRHHNHINIQMDAQTIREQSALLLMLQYQTQWITLHKSFLSPNVVSQAESPSSPSSPTTVPNYTLQQRTDRSLAICTDAAKRIVIMSEVITERFDWCVCQQFVTCIYQASTVFCKSMLGKDANHDASKAMIQRIIAVLAASKLNYQGLPDDLTACLNEFLAEHESNADGEEPSSTLRSTGEGFDMFLDQIFSDESMRLHSVTYNDTLFNSPHMFKDCLNQSTTFKPPLTAKKPAPSVAMLSLNMQNPSMASLDDLDSDGSNWR